MPDMRQWAKKSFDELPDDISVNYVWRCDMCGEDIKEFKEYNKYSYTTDIYLLLISFAWQTNMTALQRMYLPHDCNGDQSVFGVARLIGIEKVE